MVRLGGDLAPGEPHNPDPGGEERRVAPTVLLERVTRAVGRVAVGLRGELVGRPEEVDLVPGDDPVCVRAGEGGRLAEVEEASFELAAEQDAFPVGGERCAKAGSAAPSRCLRELLVQHTGIEDAQLLCPSEDAVQCALVDDGGEVGDRPRDAGAGDAAFLGDVVRVKAVRAVHHDAGALPGAAPSGRDVDCRAPIRSQIP